ncbi:hypothetical protein Btru_074853 [Bulinus truncatus]|nr:hypothetical protein Btru_074853 [Bulinus truncatus]
MAKSKKNRQKDFQKVKLKVGKKLPKGDNVTNLSFKTRQIKFTQKIRVGDGTNVVTRNNLGIVDLLRQCDHHSSTARVNAVCGLKELWINHSSDLMVSSNVNGYGVILKKLSTLLIDNESLVRHSVINLFKLILTKLASKTAKGQQVHTLGGSLFTYIHTYLCCAMNHIYEDIKLDALLLFDALLDTFPSLMIQQTGDLLKNLVGLISAPAYIGSKACTTTQKLSLNPDSKLTAMKYRAKVLQRIKRTFMVALNDELKNKSSQENKTEKDFKWSVKLEGQAQNSCLITEDAESKFSVLFFGGSHELDDYIINPASLETFLEIAIPVLLQCWKEAQASIDEQLSSDVLLPADSLEVMSLVASIIQLMFVLCTSSQKKDQCSFEPKFQMVSTELLVSKYMQDFEQIFLNSFPYTAQALPELSKKRKRNKIIQHAGSSESAQMSMNLSLCDIACTFYTNVTLRPDKSLKKVRDYIQGIFRKALNTEHIKVLIRIFKNVFRNPHTAGFFVQPYKAALKYYLSYSVETSQKHLFYTLFSFMSQTWDGWEREMIGPQSVCKYTRNKDIQSLISEFCENLPLLLMSVIKNGGHNWKVNVLSLIQNCCMQKSRVMLKELLVKKLSDTLDLQTIILKCDDQQIQHRFFFLLSSGIPLTRDTFKQILYCVRRPLDKPVLQHKNVISYVIYNIMLDIRELVPLKDQVEFNKMNENQHNQLSDYLRFLFSLQIGFISEELDENYPVILTKEKTDFMTVDFKVEGDQWTRHMEISEIVAKEIANFYIPACPEQGYSQVFSFIGNIEQLWNQTFVKRCTIHVITVYSLLQLCIEISCPHVPVKLSSDFYSLANWIVTSMLLGLFSKDQSVGEEISRHMKSEMIKCFIKDTCLLTGVTDLLNKSIEDVSTSAESKSSATTAKDFLVANNILTV